MSSFLFPTPVAHPFPERYAFHTARGRFFPLAIQRHAFRDDEINRPINGERRAAMEITRLRLAQERRREQRGPSTVVP